MALWSPGGDDARRFGLWRPWSTVGRGPGQKDRRINGLLPRSRDWKCRDATDASSVMDPRVTDVVAVWVAATERAGGKRLRFGPRNLHPRGPEVQYVDEGWAEPSERRASFRRRMLPGRSAVLAELEGDNMEMGWERSALYDVDSGGRSLISGDPDGPLVWGHPLWLLDGLTGATTVREETNSAREPSATLVVDVEIDPELAERKAPGGIGVPVVPRTRPTMPARLWINQRHEIEEMSYSWPSRTPRRASIYRRLTGVDLGVPHWWTTRLS